jgi:hypothetical protein
MLLNMLARWPSVLNSIEPNVRQRTRDLVFSRRTLSFSKMRRSQFYLPPLPLKYSHMPLPPPLRDLKRPPTLFPLDVARHQQTGLSVSDRMNVNTLHAENTSTPPPEYNVLKAEEKPESEKENEDKLEEGEIIGNEEDESGIPPPTDTEPIETLMLPCGRRDFPKPPVHLRPDPDWQAYDDFVNVRAEDQEVHSYPFFAPHIIALSWERLFYPFVETNCSGPAMDKSIPIEDRPYYPHFNQDIFYPIQRIKRQVTVNMQTMEVVPPSSNVPVGRSTIFLVLAP